ncbi:uncharacterized protein LOC127860835 isoform X2 [Dreissena polymorpha]|uniref:uncharacterized protein LOC127860835 isoform X2 n=1 Tax=Dreissena polymorpha TaxID=45954 RepID=UPI0022654AB6|nr:uncharacterized protein LOC127860835 isoform X2 [Dreissena polymorpha]
MILLLLSHSESLSSKDEKLKNVTEVHFMGILPDIKLTGSATRDREAQLVDRIEEAQIEGRLPMSAQEESRVKLNVSLHGIQVLDLKGQEVLQRHPLHTIAQVVHYSDGGSINNIAFKIGLVDKHTYSAYVFQCVSEEHAVLICQQVKSMFDKVTEKGR